MSTANEKSRHLLLKTKLDRTYLVLRRQIS
jgi:hypothetical protein